MSGLDFNRMIVMSFIKEYAKAFLAKEGIKGYVLQFVCDDCVDNDHEACLERNAGRDYSDCDCQHKQVNNA